MDSAIINTAFGYIAMESDGHALTRCYPVSQSSGVAVTPTISPLLLEATTQLNEYFSGIRREFTVPLNPFFKATPFCRKVWEQLMLIPYGESISYAELARRCGNPKACRAVAQACGRNPLPIFIPCHRVIASDGTLGGYAYGLPLKRHLLNLERSHP